MAAFVREGCGTPIERLTTHRRVPFSGRQDRHFGPDMLPGRSYGMQTRAAVHAFPLPRRNFYSSLLHLKQLQAHTLSEGRLNCHYYTGSHHPGIHNKLPKISFPWEFSTSQIFSAPIEIKYSN